MLLQNNAEVEIIIKNLQNRITLNQKKIKSIILKVLAQEKTKKTGEIIVCFMDDRRIKELNLKYLRQNSPTDVIAFDISDNKKGILGNIAVSVDTAMRNARIFETSLLYELYLYAIHGILHLLGYTDKSRKDAMIMRQKEMFLLKDLNL